MCVTSTNGFEVGLNVWRLRVEKLGLVVVVIYRYRMQSLYASCDVFGEKEMLVTLRIVRNQSWT